MPAPSFLPQPPAANAPPPGFLQRLTHTLLTRAPYIGPVYNAAGTLVHAGEGTLGQWGKPTSPIGALFKALFPNFNPLAAGQLPTNTETNNPPMYGGPAANTPPASVPATGTPSPNVGATLGPGGIPLDVWREVYRTGRFTDAPAFSGTLAQAMFPGSMIGPLGGGNSNPYVGQQFHPAGSHSGLFGSTQVMLDAMRKLQQ